MDLQNKEKYIVTLEDLAEFKRLLTADFSLDYADSGDMDIFKDEVIDPNLPVAGTSLSDMTFAQIQAVAKAGKAADYNIKVGDTIKVKNSFNSTIQTKATIDARVINIYDDNIEFMTVESVLQVANQGYPDSATIDGKTVTYNANTSSYFIEPQVAYNGKANIATIGYVGSNIQTKLQAWLETQDADFKSVLKEVSRTYDTATLTYNTSTKSYSISAINQNAAAVNEKIYIPTKNEGLTLIENNLLKDTETTTWYATPFEGWSGGALGSSANYSFGSFYCNKSGNLSGNYAWGAVACFRIG